MIICSGRFCNEIKDPAASCGIFDPRGIRQVSLLALCSCKHGTWLIARGNNRVLKGLICSLLHLNTEQVQKVTITNPIELGETIDNKTFFLDVRVMMNDQTYINLEMQIVNEYDWVERSLCYLCRSFDNLERGQAYREVKPSIQIGLLNFTLFPENPEFYATYQFLNVKNHMLYSDKLRLSVLRKR